MLRLVKMCNYAVTTLLMGEMIMQSLHEGAVFFFVRQSAFTGSSLAFLASSHHDLVASAQLLSVMLTVAV